MLLYRFEETFRKLFDAFFHEFFNSRELAPPIKCEELKKIRTICYFYDQLSNHGSISNINA